jgi:hypothetical protein
MGNLPPMKMRIALVTRSPDSTVIETAVEGGVMPVGPVVMHMVLASADLALKKVEMQVATADPMDAPLEMTGGKPFTKPNPKSLVGSETLKTAAGTFKTKHYREKTSEGDKIDSWVNDTVLPLGLVKIEVDQKNPQFKGKLAFEVTGMGKDAKPAVTKPAKPFDQTALMQQMMGGGAGGAKPAPAPAAAPAPAPAPAPPAKK